MHLSQEYRSSSPQPSIPFGNTRDIEVFRTISDHDTFRFDITEIIYDDTRFHEIHEATWDKSLYFEDDDDIGDITGVPCWFRHWYRENRGEMESYCDGEVKDSRQLEAREALKALSSPAESYEYFQKLLQQQTEIISINRDVDALKYELSRFPNLRRVTLTLPAHDVIEFLRALPATLESVELSFLAFILDDDHYKSLWEDIRAKLGWRERVAMTQPKLVICVEGYFAALTEDNVSLRREAMEFVYGEGTNPFGEDVGFWLDLYDRMDE
ncbi:hypothetical protein FSARC_2975 [Fusarium sarcochroum]|uniref:Uncharacterized protein n=1 Tax=Fusarium sarcochroum TaxID=1208366 RepID=A0A8H4U5E6_9HYPO|nr:hypothetical protein FSARC_2975 [Fusarium sarcochroum]